MNVKRLKAVSPASSCKVCKGQILSFFSIPTNFPIYVYLLFSTYSLLIHRIESFQISQYNLLSSNRFRKYFDESRNSRSLLENITTKKSLSVQNQNTDLSRFNLSSNIFVINEEQRQANVSDNERIDEQIYMAYQKELNKATLILQSELHFKKRSIVTNLFQNHPELLKAYSAVVDTDHKTPIQKLRSHVGIGREKLHNMAIKHPTLFANIIIQQSKMTTDPNTNDKQQNLKSTLDVLRHDLGVTTKQIKDIEKIAPDVLRRCYRLDLRRKLHFFRTFVIYDDDDESLSSSSLDESKTKRTSSKAKSKIVKRQLQKILLKRPQLLAYSIENLKDTIQFFTDELDLSKKEIDKMVTCMPLVLTYSVNKKLRPTVEFFYEEIGCTEQQIRKMCYRYPQVLSQSVENNLIPKVKFLRRVLHLEAWDDLARLITFFPPLLWLSETNICAKIDFFQKELNLSEKELCDMLLTMPALLGLSVEGNLRPKINYFLQREDTKIKSPTNKISGNIENEDGSEDDWKIDGGGGLTRSELKEFVLYQPALLAYSLKNRIIPRLKRMREANISLTFSPPYVLSITDDKFNQWITMQSNSWTVM